MRRFRESYISWNFFSRTSRHVIQFNLHLLILKISSNDLLRLSYNSSASHHSPDPLHQPSLLSRVYLLFILDYGVSYHMTSDFTLLFNNIPLPSHFLPLHTADGSQLVISHMIYYLSHTHLAFSFTCFTFIMNLISISSLCEIGLILLSITSLVLYRMLS